MEDKAPSLELPPGLNGVDYKQKFVRAKMETSYPCNHEAEKTPHEKVMRQVLIAK
jgi:hypothetical protein